MPDQNSEEDNCSMKIGIFGGAFNPVHIGHIQLAQNYLKLLNLDKLLLVPTAVPPHKTAENLAPQKARLDMLHIAVKDIPKIEISDIEFKREGKSYTFDTLTELEKIYPHSEFCLIIGADQFLSFNKWYRWEDILSKVTLCTCAREDEEEKKKIIDFSHTLGINNNDKFFLLDVPVLKLCSSEIRDKISKGENAASLLPNGVYEYIKKEGLYSV